MTPGIFAGTDGQLSGNGYRTCLLNRITGKVRCWGFRSDETKLGPMEIDLPLPAVQVSVGLTHVCAVLQGGAIYCWDSNYFGQLGIGSFGGRVDTPTRVLGITNATPVSAGWKSTCARLADGTARCWGDGTNGQLCSGTTNNSATPVRVVGLLNIAEMRAGFFNGCARLANGTVHCCGSNERGQLGIGSVNTIANPTPVQVQGLSDATQLSVAAVYTCAVRATGTVVCWGAGWGGELGNGTDLNFYIPNPVSDLADVVQLDTTDGHVCARKSNGQVLCWGENSDGQLGDGTQLTRAVPTAVVW